MYGDGARVLQRASGPCRRSVASMQCLSLWRAGTWCSLPPLTSRPSTGRRAIASKFLCAKSKAKCRRAVLQKRSESDRWRT